LPEAVTADKMKLTVTSYDGGTAGWASVSIIEIEVYSAESVSLGDVAASLNTMAGTVVEGDTLPLPEVPDGITVAVNGADFEQIIAKDGSVHHPLTDKTVNVSFQVSDGTNSALTADIPVTVKGLYTQGEGNTKPVIIPEIQEWYSDSTAKLAIGDVTKVTYDDATLKAVVDEFVADYEAFTSITLTAVQGAAEAGAFNFSLTAPDALLGDEGYTMQILSDRINVASGSTTGNMYGMQTILQMTRTDAEGFAVGQMRDYPRFTVRGLLLDIARKPIAMTMVGDISRTMRYYKMNDLHIHLNDNYIWLEDYGTYANEDLGFNAYEAFRLESSLTNDAGEDPTAEDYAISKEEFRTFIQDQRSLGMNIIPEIDVPAHAMAFTKVWPELSIDNEVRSGHTLIDHFNLSLPESVAKIKAIFDDYTKATDTVPATFDEDTIVHIGADEYYLSGTLYRQYFNEMVPYIKQTNTVRIWGSLTQMNDNNQTKIIPEAIEGVQMNIWSAGWANYQDMFDMGFGLINTIDTYGYMVPNGNGNRGAYGDYLNLNSVFSSFKPNQVGSITLPSGDDRVLGAAFAIWNDNIDKRSSGLTESDIFTRFFDALPLYAEKTWAATGQEKGSAAALTELSKTVGIAPNTNPYFQIESKGDTRVSYDFDGLADGSGNGYDLTAGTAAVENGALTLNGGSSYVTSPVKKIGNGNALSFDITLTEAAEPGDILFETTPEYYTHDIRIMDDGTLGFTRELHDYSFGYTLPVGTTHIEIVAEQQTTSLYVNGELVGTATGKFVHNGVEKKTGITHSTFALPLERIGSETNSINAVIDNVKVVKTADPADASRDIPVEVLTATAGDWQTGYEATEGPANLVLDGDPSTIWHTNWYGTSRANHWIQFELSEDYVVDGLRYQPRQNGSNGNITEYQILVSDDGVNFESVATGTWAGNSSWKTVSFDGVQAKYVRLVAVNAMTDNSYVFASAAEIRLTGVKAAAHEHDYQAVVTEPTCTEEGYTTYTCECGDSYVADKTPALGHNWQEDGSCSRCDEIQDGPAVNPFVDVPEDIYFYDPVMWALENGITKGIDDTHFAPGMDCIRAQVVTFLWRAAGSPEPTITENPFVDVKEEDYYYEAVMWALENGITKGIDATHFGSTLKCSRAYVVTFLYRALGEPEVSTTECIFDDVVDPEVYYYTPVVWAVENGITKG
ncbi:MAG: discoidin domain-containing protein, partial [Oscillospiraceae bacterium]|nr:discoidin domain-containing protein [Oscillospiraceae bacterium]